MTKSKKPTPRELLEDRANVYSREGSHDWGEHGEGFHACDDGRKSRYPKLRHEPKGKRWEPLIGGEHKG